VKEEREEAQPTHNDREPRQNARPSSTTESARRKGLRKSYSGDGEG